jgi:hypothetical protein
MEELAKRVVACKGWRWMAGMLVRTGNSTMRLDGVDVDGRAVRYERSGSDRCACYPGWPSEKVLPDLTDPATVGCLMALVREAWKYQAIFTRPILMNGNAVWWNVETFDSLISTDRSEVAALVAALEAAP